MFQTAWRVVATILLTIVMVAWIAQNPVRVPPNLAQGFKPKTTAGCQGEALQPGGADPWGGFPWRAPMLGFLPALI